MKVCNLRTGIDIEKFPPPQTVLFRWESGGLREMEADPTRYYCQPPAILWMVLMDALMMTQHRARQRLATAGLDPTRAAVAKGEYIIMTSQWLVAAPRWPPWVQLDWAHSSHRSFIKQRLKSFLPHRNQNENAREPANSRSRRVRNSASEHSVHR